MFELLTAPTGNGRRPTVMLEECGLPYNVKLVDLASGEQRAPEFREINPQCAIPVLLHHTDGEVRAIPQSGAILLYLSELTGKFLEPSGPQRYRTLSRFFMVQTDVAASSSAIYQAASVLPVRSGENEQFYLARFLSLMGVVETWLSDALYLSGPEPSIADFALISVAVQRRNLIPTSGFPRLSEWIDRMYARPTTRRGLGW